MDFQYQNSAQIADQIKQSQVAILPVGAVEAHGPHLPLGTDNLLAERVAAKLAKRVNGFVLPVLPYGQVWSLQDFPGSLSISNQTLTAIITELGSGLFDQGFRVLVIVNGHYGNQPAIKDATRNLYDKYQHCKAFNMFYPGTKQIIQELRQSKPVHDSYFHACEIETSYMLHLAPEYVEMDKAINDTPHIPPDADVTPTPWSQFTKTAVLGDATLATPEKGEQIIEVALQSMTMMIKEAKQNLQRIGEEQ